MLQCYNIKFVEKLFIGFENWPRHDQVAYDKYTYKYIYL